MLHDPKIGIHAAPELFLLFSCRLMIAGDVVLFLNWLVEVAFGAVGDVNAVWLDYSPKIFYTLGIMLKIDFAGMKLHLSVLSKVFPHFRNDGFQVFLILMNQDEIINIPAIIPDLQISFHKMVEIAQIDIPE